VVRSESPAPCALFDVQSIRQFPRGAAFPIEPRRFGHEVPGKISEWVLERELDVSEGFSFHFTHPPGWLGDVEAFVKGIGLKLPCDLCDVHKFVDSVVAHGVDRSLFFGFFTHFSYISLKSCNSVDRFPSDHPSIFFPVFLRFSVSLQEPWKLVETHRRS
jgi:hypothetical protein